MKFFDLFKRVLREESLPEGKSGILLLDIDDTLLQSDASMMKIYRKLPTDAKEIGLSSDEYAKENVTPELKKYYDYRDFRDPKKVYASIVKGAPLLNNLKVVDAFVNGGYKLGVLTARGCEDAVAKAIKTFLKVRDENGNLVKPNISRDDIHAVNDDEKVYAGATDFQKKQNVLRDYARKYDYVYFMDDDFKNLNALQALKKEDPEIANRLRSINAKKNVVKEEVISEMAVKDVTQDVVSLINDGKLGEALVGYFNTIKTQEAYADKKDVTSAFKHMLSFGIVRTFGALEKKGVVGEGAALALKQYGLEHINELVKNIDYKANPSYVAPKRVTELVRRKLSAVNLDDLKAKIKKYEGYGWKTAGEIKEGSTKALSHFYYVYIVGKKGLQIDETEIIKNELLAEMAVKDVTPSILSAISAGDYDSAIREYFNSIKDTGKYADKPTDEAKAIHMRSYGLSRTFGALEKKGAIPSGATEALKTAANKMIEDLRAAAPSEPKKVEPKKEAKPVAKQKEELFGAKKIAARIKKYEKLINDIDDYMYTSKAIQAYVVDVSKNGPSGVDSSLKKPKLKDVDMDNIFQTKSERLIAPMLKFRKNFIPKFVQDKIMKGLTSDDKKNLEKAETLGSEYVEATTNRILAKGMSYFLNNIVMGFKEVEQDAKKENMSDDEILSALKSNVDFPYDDFVKLEKWMKELKMANDKRAYEVASEKSKTKSAGVPEEINKVKTEYITFINAIERAIASDSIGNFMAQPTNYAVVRAALEVGRDGFPKAIEGKALRTADAAKNTESELLPSLKAAYRDRVDETGEPNAQVNYAKLDNHLNGLMTQRMAFVKAGDEKAVNDIDAKIEKDAKEIINVFMDRLIGVDMVVSSANSAILDNFKAAADRMKKISDRYEKMYPAKAGQKKFDPESEKYKQYYDPETDEDGKAAGIDDMYKKVQAAVDELPIEKLLEKKLQVAKAINLKYKRYTDDEIKELYDALEQSKEKLYELLATPKYVSRRNG